MTSPSTTLSAALDDLAWAIARDGIEQHEPAVARAVLALRSAGAVALLLDLVADRDQPAVARERAFGRLGLPSPPPAGATPGASPPERAQPPTTARTSAVTPAPMAMTAGKGRRRQAATAAAATPGTRASITSS